ncbi:hypothetical protein F5888DRAFT_1632085 [Russula emetica]|nr:hypothetical protein F5888DRAFT_1632085 [Russula emetica]
MSEQYYSVLVDGYMSQCFGPQQAEQHFFNILKSNTISASYLPGTEGGSFIATSVPEYIRVQFPNPYTWVLDRRVVGHGTVVPQSLWIPFTITDRRRHVQDAELNMPIFFLHVDGRLGLPLDAAVIGRCDTLLNAKIPAPLGPQTTTHIRFGWRGYREFKRQVQIRDETPQHNTITLSKFAQHIGRSVEVFIKNRQLDTKNPVPQWHIGEGGVQPHEIVIVGAIQVSSGGWMPILQLTRYIF